MGVVRKLLVKHFVFGTWFKVFGRTWYMMRSPRILFPAFCIVGSIISFDSTWPKLQWYDYVLLGVLTILVWIGFGFWDWGYFRLFPFTYEELDDEQKFGYLKMKHSGLLKSDGKFGQVLSPEEFKEYLTLLDHYKKLTKDKTFYQVYNLLGLAIGVLVVLISFFIFSR